LSLYYNITDEAIDSHAHIISVGGEVDLHAAPDLKERIVGLIEEGKRQLVVDLTDATFIDSTAIGILVGARNRLLESGGSLEVACSHKNVLKVFEITGLERVLSLHLERSDAVSALALPA
jgi:anti-sigma B factor antagonist